VLEGLERSPGPGPEHPDRIRGNGQAAIIQTSLKIGDSFPVLAGAEGERGRGRN
jgi:hypothetical protein